MGLDTLKIIQNGAILRATISAGDINMLDWKLMSDLNDLLDRVIADETVKVLVLDSANEDFFVAHFDLLPRPESTLPEMHPEYPQIGYLFGLLQKLATAPVVTIALVEGRARGGGADLANHCDMRFGIHGRTILQQCEVMVGLSSSSLPSSLVRIMGPSRALEVALAAEDVDAALAERYGWLNRAFQDKAGLEEHVSNICSRMGKFQRYSLQLNKKMVTDRVYPMEQMVATYQDFTKALSSQKTIELIGKAFEAVNGAVYGEEELDLSNTLLHIQN